LTPKSGKKQEKGGKSGIYKVGERRVSHLERQGRGKKTQKTPLKQEKAKGARLNF